MMVKSASTGVLTKVIDGRGDAVNADVTIQDRFACQLQLSRKSARLYVTHGSLLDMRLAQGPSSDAERIRDVVEDDDEQQIGEVDVWRVILAVMYVDDVVRQHGHEWRPSDGW